MTEASVPESSRLPFPYEVKPPSKEARLSFWELAKSRVRYVTPEEMLAVRTQVGKIADFDPQDIAFAIVAKRVDEEIDPKKKLLSVIRMIKRKESPKDIFAEIIAPEQRKWVNALEIYISKQAFNIKGQDYSDLIPYVIEHEICEKWARDKRGFIATPMQAHQLARRHEFRIAVCDGKAERLLEFIKVAAPGNVQEAEEAYQTALRRKR